MKESNYIYPEIKDEEYILKTIYDFYISKKYKNCGYYKFVNEVENFDFFRKKGTVFSDIIRKSDNEKVGIIGLLFISEFIFTEAFIDYIIIFPQYRNMGIATETINFLKSICVQITLRTCIENVKFFNKLDFEIIDEEYGLNSMIPMVWNNIDI